MNRTRLTAFLLPLSLVIACSEAQTCRADPNTGPPTNLHRRFVVQQAKRNAAQGKPTRRHVGVWLSGGYERTVAKARSGAYRRRPFFRRR